MKPKMLITALLFFPLFIRAQDDSISIKTEGLGKGLYKIHVGTTSLVASIGSDGVFLADAAYVETGPNLREELNRLGGTSVDIIVNSHWHHDHCGGSVTFGSEALVISHPKVRECLSKPQVAQGDSYEAFPAHALPDLTFTGEMTLHFNDEEIHLRPLPDGHSDGDVVIHFKNANVIFLGDLVFPDMFPAIDYEHGGHADIFVRNLDFLLNYIPEEAQIISAHGRNLTRSELSQYRDMIRETVDVIRNSRANGMDLETMKNAKILEPWAKWGEIHVTCDQWIEMVYLSLGL